MMAPQLAAEGAQQRPAEACSLRRPRSAHRASGGVCGALCCAALIAVRASAIKVVGEGEECNSSLPPEHATVCPEGLECVRAADKEGLMGAPGVCTVKDEAEACKDRLPECADLAEKCAGDADTRMKCPLTCALCGCKDDPAADCASHEDECNSPASEQNHEAEIRKACPKTCRLCGPGRQGPATSYVHAFYEFSLDRMNMRRKGHGEIWFGFNADGIPQMRLRGAARSPRFGDGEITVVADGVTQKVYAQFKLGELHETQCVTYPFPTLDDNAYRIDRLRSFESQVKEWQDNPGALEHLAVEWGSQYSVDFKFVKSGTQIGGMVLKNKDKSVKTVQFIEAPEDSMEPGMDPFAPPSMECQDATAVNNPLAKIEFKPPHQKSSALNDLLLTMADFPKSDREWSKLFVFLSAARVPGDVAVLIEDPEPPHPENFGEVSFDYVTKILKLGGNLSFSDPAVDISDHIEHTSSGNIWLSLKRHAFTLHDTQAETKVGPVDIDLMVMGDMASEEGELFAHINLNVQEEEQCIIFDYPDPNATELATLTSLAAQKLTFFAVSEISGDDCGIFVAPISRGRWLHVWVDMESDHPDAILRTEVRRDGQLLRRTDIQNWHFGDDTKAVKLLPDSTWGCAKHAAGPKFAHLGLRDPESWSAELTDALHAQRSMPGSWAVLHALALAGDVNLMVEGPLLPELWRLPALSFGYSVYLWSSMDAKSVGDMEREAVLNQVREDKERMATLEASMRQAEEYVDGTFVADQRLGWVGFKANAGQGKHVNLSVVVGPSSIAIRAQEPGVKEPTCILLPLDSTSEGVKNVGPLTPEGTFDGVESIGEFQCNRFTFANAGPHHETVRFWYSQKEASVCQLQMSPPQTSSDTEGMGTGTLVYVPMWQHVYTRADYNALVAAADFPPERASASGMQSPPGWNCKPAAEMAQPWAEVLPAGSEQYELVAQGQKCAEEALGQTEKSEIMSWDGPAVDYVHGCFELCRMRPGCQYFTFLKGVSCTIYQAPCEQVEDPEQRSLYVRHFLDVEPTSHAISKLAEVAGVVGLLPEASAAALSRLVVKAPSQKQPDIPPVPPPLGTDASATQPSANPASPPPEQVPQEPEPEPVKPISILSPDLDEFTFHFISRPSNYRPGDDQGNPTTPRSPKGGRGVIRVSLSKKKFFMRSEVLNVSSGIPQAQSVVIYDGQTSQLHAQTRMDHGLFEECWQLEVPPGDLDHKVNPFAAAQKTNGQSSWYDFYAYNPNARVELSVTQDTGALEELWFEDLTRHTTTNVLVSQWSTEPVSEVWWTHRGKSSCPSLKYQDHSKKLARWQLINIFFPLPTPLPISRKK